MKSHLRKSAASGSTIQRVERMARQGERAMRRALFASNRAKKFHSQDEVTSYAAASVQEGGVNEV